MEFKISNNELKELLIKKSKEFPKYTSGFINMANRYSQGTRPKVVGQLSELIKECPYNTYEEWRKWYLEREPDAIDNATKIIAQMMDKLKDSIKKIDNNLIKEWVEDLVLIKTFIGLKFQEAILKKVASNMGKDYRLSTPDEESHGIDGFIGNVPISIKPVTYKAKPELIEHIDAKIIFYEKVTDGVKVDTSQLYFNKTVNNNK